MISVDMEKIMYHGVRKDPDYLNTCLPSFFTNKDYQTLLRIDKKFFEIYKELPTKGQIYKIAQNKKIEQITENKLDAIFNINLDEYQKDWLKENVIAWIKWKNIETTMEQAIEYIKTTEPDINNISEITETIRDLFINKTNIDLEYDIGLDFFNPDSHYQPSIDTFPTGYPFLDEKLGGGWQKKTLVCLIGEAKKGKSIWLGNLAANSVLMGKNVCFISFEMSGRKIAKRIGANVLNIEMAEYNSFATDTDRVKGKLNNLNDKVALTTPGHFFIKEFPTSAVGVPEIESYLRKTEDIKQIKFDLIVIDYINIMKNFRNPNTDSTYMKIKQIAEDLRAMSTRNNWVIMTASQINREGFGSSQISTRNISESIGLLHTVDAMFAIIQDESLKLQNRYILKALALREADGVDDICDFNVDYSHMKITQSNGNHLTLRPMRQQTESSASILGDLLT